MLLLLVVEKNEGKGSYIYIHEALASTGTRRMHRVQAKMPLGKVAGDIVLPAPSKWSLPHTQPTLIKYSKSQALMSI